MLAGDNGILQKATTAKESTDSSQIQERINLAYHSSLVDGQGKVTEPSLESEIKKEFNKATLEEGWLDKTSVEGKWKITIDNVSLEVPAGIEAITSARVHITPAPTGTTYTDGTEVTFGGEQFFVIGDDGTTVRLLAKYCLSKTENTQLDKTATMDNYGRIFSKTSYWSSLFTSDPFDLQTDSMKAAAVNDGDVAEGIKNAVEKAQAYGTAKGVTGRLMTYAEANALKTDSNKKMARILLGYWLATEASDPPNQGFLRWWLGSALEPGYVWTVYGTDGLEGRTWWHRRLEL